MSVVETRWLIVGLPDQRKVKIELSVGTTAPKVIRVIEEAAARNGIKLQRVA